MKVRDVLAEMVRRNTTAHNPALADMIAWIEGQSTRKRYWASYYKDNAERLKFKNATRKVKRKRKANA